MQLEKTLEGIDLICENPLEESVLRELGGYKFNAEFISLATFASTKWQSKLRLEKDTESLEKS